MTLAIFYLPRLLLQLSTTTTTPSDSLSSHALTHTHDHTGRGKNNSMPAGNRDGKSERPTCKSISKHLTVTAIEDLFNIPSNDRNPTALTCGHAINPTCLLKKTTRDTPRTTNFSNKYHKDAVKQNAPIMLTYNHSNRKLREDGICNGNRGSVTRIDFSKKPGEENEIAVIWVEFYDKSGLLYKEEMRRKKKLFHPNPHAIPILPVSTTFTLEKNRLKYKRYGFPLILGFCHTAHKIQAG